MKILMVNKFLYPAGGAETYMFKLGNQLQSMGNEVEYFGMYHDDNCVGNSLQCYTNFVDFRTAGILEKITDSLKTIYSFEAKKKIGLVLDSFNPDVVHLNNINFQLTPSVIYEIKKRNIPIVQTVHDVQIACPNHRMYIEHRERICSECLNGKYTNCIKNKCVHNSTLKSCLATLESYYYHKRNTYNLVDSYICPSQFMADSIIKGGVKEEKIKVLHNFCENTNSDTIKKSANKYVLYFGRLSVEKGIKTLVQCCKDLSNIQFIFAGTGPLEDICKGIKNINAVGFKSGQELKQLISNAIFTVCPSEWYENCPMSVVESLSLGTPVIVSDLGGAKELITENETGLIFKAGDIEALKNAVSTLYNNIELLQNMSKKCIKSSTNTAEKYSKTVLEIYSSLINKERYNYGKTCIKNHKRN